MISYSSLILCRTRQQQLQSCLPFLIRNITNSTKTTAISTQQYYSCTFHVHTRLLCDDVDYWYVGTRYFSTNIDRSSMPIRVSLASSSSSSSRISELRQQTRELLKVPVGSWTLQDTSKGRFLMNEWSSNDNFKNNNKQSPAIQQTKILRRWIKEFEYVLNNTQIKKKSNNVVVSDARGLFLNTSKSSRELLEMLHRCIDSWRKVDVKNNDNTSSRQREEILELIEWVERLSKQTNNPHIQPNHKTYSMFINMLGEQYPSSPTVINDILSSFDRCQEKDIQFYGICLHVLAKCSVCHKEAPVVAERIFQELLSTNTIKPDTVCFVSLLHAWSNNCVHHHQESDDSTESDSSPAIRAEAILQEMIKNHYELVNTICFNICIEAYAKLGRPDEAEEILWTMQKLYQQNQQQDVVENDRLRPNLTSYNSAIKAWTQRNNRTGNQNPENVVQRAELLLERMEVSGVTPSIETFTLLMQAIIKTSAPGERVQAILDKLEARYTNGDIVSPPSSVCYLIAIQAWGRTTLTKLISLARDRRVGEISPPEMAEMLVNRMIDLSSSDSTRRDLKPCVMIFTALIDAWGNSFHPEALEHALRIFTDMQRGKLGRKASPNTVTLNVLLKAFCRHGRIDHAWDFLTKLKNYIAPDLKSYHTILKASAHSDVVNAVELAQEIVNTLESEYQSHGNESLKPNKYTYSQLLVALGNCRRHDAAIQAENVFWKMVNQDVTSVKPTTYHLNCVLRAWLRCPEGGAAERAEDFLEQVLRTGQIESDVISHMHMIQVWIQSGRSISKQKGQLHLEKMRTLCNDNNSSILDAAVTALLKASRYYAP